MKKINKTVLLASTLFISSAISITDKSYADEDYKLNLNEGLEESSQKTEDEPSSEDLSPEEEKANYDELDKAKESLKEEGFIKYSDSEDKDLADDQSLETREDQPLETREDEAYEDTENENLDKAQAFKEDQEAKLENDKADDGNLDDENSDDLNLIYYDDTDLDESVENIRENKSQTVIDQKTEIKEKKYHSKGMPGYFVKDNNSLKYYENDKLVKNSNFMMDSRIFRAGKDGSITNPKNSWLNIGNDIYYNKEDGNITRGISEVKGDKYYFNNDGILQRNKKIITNGSYYEVSNTGKMSLVPNKWVSVNKNIYRTLEDGAIAKGITNISGRDFIFDKTGKLQTNKKIIANDKFYDVNQAGIITNPKNAWFTINGESYRTGSDGKLVKGIADINGNTYVFSYKTGAMIVGRPSITNGRYFDIDNRGVATNPKNAWVEYEGKTYHTNDAGFIKEGVWNIDGKLYYFGKDGLQKNTKVIQQGIEYIVDENGVATAIDNRQAGERNLDKVMEWMFVARDNGMYYDMGAKRNTTEAADCSSAVYRSLIYGGFLDKNSFIGNTETLFAMGARGSVMYEISKDQIDYGDIFVSGIPGKSIGAGGHTGFILNPVEDTIIHMSYSQDGVAVTPREGHTGESSSRPIKYYRLVGAKSDKKFINKK